MMREVYGDKIDGLSVRVFNRMENLLLMADEDEDDCWGDGGIMGVEGGVDALPIEPVGSV
jgi:hypothetical protein